jgi:pyrroloquinoline quinone biosynthesis protein D
MPRLRAMYRVHWEESVESYALLYPAGMVYLTPQERSVLELCDGAHQVQEILRADAGDEWPDTAAAILEFAFQNGWLAQDE